MNASDRSGEPQAKRLKTESTDRLAFFKQFRKNETNFDALKIALLSLRYGFDDAFLNVLNLTATNACLSERFSRAGCKVNKFKKSNGGARVFSVGSIFKRGERVLRNYLEKGRLPERENKQEALFKLLKFVEDQELSLAALLHCDECDETQWAVRVAQHLLLPLSVAESYLIDDCYDGVKRLRECPCKAADNMRGCPGDTSFGWIDGWHGRTDIIVNSVAVDLAKPSELEKEELESSVSSTEVELSSNFNERDLQEIIAQTIVFSFLQHKENDGNYKHSLVPGIGISKMKFVSYFYDCNDDVLLGSQQLNLFGQQSFNHIAIVFLWLTLNYKIFCTGITDSMKNFKAEFFDRVGRFLEHYQNDVARGVAKKVSDENTGKDYPIVPREDFNDDSEDEYMEMEEMSSL